MKYNFPTGFLWGTSVSSHQVEGGNRNDWTEWEKKNAARLAREAKNIWALWQQEKFPEMFNEQNYISGNAADFWNTYDEDFKIAKNLGMNAQRFSIEWSRVEPTEGAWDEDVIQQYRAMIDSARKKGLEPIVCLWHWTLPLWIAHRGGWRWKETPKYFERFVEKIAKEVGATYWLTLNEPNIWAGHTYVKGVWPPAQRRPWVYFSAMRNLIRAHKRAYQVIKKINPNTQVSVAYNQSYFEAYKNRWFNRVIKYIADWLWNDYFWQRIGGAYDFIGLNYYRHQRINFWFVKDKEKKISDMAWEVSPESIHRALLRLKKYKKPIIITENGLADHDDTHRTWFIKETVKGISQAIAEGVDVRGYLHWSLLDNFEWDKGFWPRFGLVKVDYKTMKRTIRESAYEYGKIAKENAITLS